MTAAKKANPRIAVVGGGIFGISAALELAKTGKVTLFEKDTSLLGGATFANHGRHHYGYHYPRSLETAQQCLAGKASFEEIYGDCLLTHFSNYYCVSKNESKTTPDDFLKFCKELKLPFEVTWPKETDLVNRNEIELCVKTIEGVYDVQELTDRTKKRLADSSNVEVRLGTPVRSVELSGDLKKLEWISPEGQVQSGEFDILIIATYARINELLGTMGLTKRSLQFNLQELNIIELPYPDLVGLTVMDGPFTSFLPYGKSGKHILAHVTASQLKREISKRDLPLMASLSSIKTNYAGVLQDSLRFSPVLAKAKYLHSILVDRVVDSGSLANDDRLSDITYHGEGVWSLFGAKVISSIETAKKLNSLVENFL